MKFLRRWKTQILLFFAVVGPGFITANVDNDAGGIWTYSSAGAQFGHTLLWTMIPITVALIVVQEMTARMGAVTGKGLSDLIREEYGFRITFFMMIGILITNFGNVIAEFAGIAGSLELFGLSKYYTVPISCVIVWLIVVKGQYKTVEKVFKYLLDRLVLSLHHDQPHDHATDGYGVILRQPEQFQTPGNPSEFSDHIAEIRDQNADHHEESNAQPKLFTDQVAESFARYRPHAGGHLLHHNQGQGDGNHGPQEGVSKLGARRRIRPDAAGIVIDVCGNKARTDNCQEQQDLGLPASQELHGHISQTWLSQRPNRINVDQQFWIDGNQFLCVEKWKLQTTNRTTACELHL